VSVEFVPGPTHHGKKDRDTILLHDENFRRPTHLVIAHQDGSSYHQSVSAALPVTSSPKMRPLGLVRSGALVENFKFSYTMIFVTKSQHSTAKEGKGIS
jgi:hypothetical protein